MRIHVIGVRTRAVQNPALSSNELRTSCRSQELARDAQRSEAFRHLLFDRVPPSSLIAVVKLVGAGIAGQAHGSLRGRHFDRLIMALDRLSRPMWCSRLSGRTSTRIPGIGLDCATVLTGRSRWYQLTIGVSVQVTRAHLAVVMTSGRVPRRSTSREGSRRAFARPPPLLFDSS